MSAAIAQQKIRIRLKAFDRRMLDLSCEKIIETADHTAATAIGPIPLPTKRKIYCVLRSPHVDKDSREHFETRTHRRIIDIYSPSAKTIDALMKLAPLEERLYRLRCVEGWSMAIPWIGYSLSELIKKVEPTGNAKYVEFTSLADPAQMKGVNSRVLDWPYVEGLRIDEANHPLALLCVGMYGQTLLNQNGAPVRLVVPWKYGFKSAKSIVRIRFTEHQPKTAWNKTAPDEYGFYSNVNPEVSHPRWSQATERRIGEDGLFTRKRKTLMFNGYPEVASLYSGMDLKKFY